MMPDYRFFRLVLQKQYSFYRQLHERYLTWVFRVTHYVILDVILYAFYDRNEVKRKYHSIHKTHANDG